MIYVTRKIFLQKFSSLTGEEQHFEGLGERYPFSNLENSLNILTEGKHAYKSANFHYIK